MRFWPRSTSRQIALCIGLALGAYLCSYIALSVHGGWSFAQSGEVRYGQTRFAASDLLVWTPCPCWYQRNHRFVTGEYGSRGNMLGYFYSPLILMDRAFVHRTRQLFEPESNS